MTTTLDEDHTAKLHVALAVLNEMNCPNDAAFEERAAMVADHLSVIDGEVCVANADGTKRTIPDPLGSGVDVPYPIDRAIREELFYTLPTLAWSGCGKIPGVRRVPPTFLGYGHGAA